MAWLAGWSYRKAIVIAHTADGAQTNYQLKLLVGESSGATGEEVDCGGKVASDFDDLRFTTSDGSTLCDYWIESLSGSTPNQLATVWIEVPSIAAHPDDTTIYMYYGNAGASAVSSGANTFVFFDDFSSNTIANYTTSGGTWSISGGVLNVLYNAGGNAICAPTTQSPPSKYVVEAKIDITNVYGIDAWMGVLGFQSTVAHTDDGYVMQIGQLGSAAKVGIEKFSQAHLATTAITWSAGTYYHVEGRYASGNLRSWFERTTAATSADATYTSGYYGLRTYLASGNFDDYRVRAYTTNEPTWSSFGAEELQSISDAIQAVWNIRKAISDASIFKWNIRKAISDSIQLVWDVLIVAAITDTIQLIWNTRKAISDSSQLVWNIRKAIADSAQVVWNTWKAIPTASQLIWHTKKAISDSVQIVWNTWKAIPTSSQLVWHIRKAISNSSQLIWNVLLSGAADSIQLVWNIRKVILDSSKLVWNINAAISDSVQLVYNINKAIADAIQLVWNTVGQIPKVIQIVWNTRLAISDSIQVVWNTWKAIASATQLKWNTLLAIVDSSQLVWYIRKAVSDSLQVVWNIRATITDSIQAVWNTWKAISDSIQLVWDTLINVVSASDAVQLVWNIKVAISDSAQLKWNINKAISDAIQTVWNLRSLASDTSQIVWNTRQAISNSIQIVWNILKYISDYIRLRWGVQSRILLKLYRTVNAQLNVRLAATKLFRRRRTTHLRRRNG
jgi:hypothetical protein